MKYTINVRSYHIDAYGHVNNARYLEFLEDGRWAFFAHHQLPIDKDLQLIVADIHIRYRRAAYLGDELYVSCHLQSYHRRKIVFRQDIHLASNHELLAQAEVMLIPAVQGKSCSLPEYLQTALAALSSIS